MPHLWCLVAALAVCGAAAPATAASLTPDREIVAVGDAVTLQMRETVPLFTFSTLYFTYALPKAAAYIPNSVVIDGTPTNDGTRVVVSADSVQISIPVPLGGIRTVSLRVRAVGSIGQVIPHRGSTRFGSNTAVAAYGPATWIVDETAIVYVPTLAADTDVSQTQPTYNYGRATTISGRTASERRPLLQFALGPIALPPGGAEVHAAYLEIWPTVTAGASLTVNAHRVRATWTEGSQDGTPCVDGATWNTRNCVSGWTPGVDYEPVPVGSATLAAGTSFVAIDVTSLAKSWIGGSKPNQGLVLTASSATSNRTYQFPSREGAGDAVPAARLVVILAPSNAYTSPAVNRCEAEIVPTRVIAGTRGQRFTYSLDARFSGSSTGAQRFTIAVPAGFTFLALDTVRVEGAPLVRNNDAVLSSGEFENWGSGTSIDVRFMPLLFGDLRRLDAVFRADCPAAVDPVGREFLSLVDHDRRGFPAQSTIRGDANDQNDDDSWTVVTAPRTVVAVHVVPADTVVASGFTVPYRAFATYNDAAIAEVTDTAAWAVIPTALGTFGPAPGQLVTALPGSGSVRAVFEGVTSAPATLVVGPPVLQSLRVTPPSASAAAGTVTGFEADAVYSDGDTTRVTATAMWSVLDSTIAQVVAPGQVRGSAPGTTGIAAEFAGVGGNATLDVTPAQLASIAVLPADTTLTLGANLQMRAVGTYTDGSSSDVTAIAVWSVIPAGVLDVDAGGLATTLGEGVARVTAAVGAIGSAEAIVTVVPPRVVAIAVAPIDTTVALGSSVQYSAVAQYSDGDRRDVTATATWSTSPGGIAVVDADGLANTLAAGSTFVRAVVDSVSSPDAALTVTPPVVVALDGAPDAAAVLLGSMHTVQSTAEYSDGTHVDVTASASWQSLDPAIADFAAAGQVQTFAAGTARLTHTFAGVTGDTLLLTVTTATIDSITIAPCGVQMPPGVARTLVATAHFSDGSTRDVSTQAEWASSDSLVATIAAGVLQAHAPGATQVTATVLGVVSPACTVTVAASAVDTLVLVPADTTIAIGTNVDYVARGFVAADVYDLSAFVAWNIDDPAIADIDSAGTATALATGTTTVWATYSALTAQATLAVFPARLERVEVVPATTTVRVGTTKNMTARAHYSDARAVDVTAVATWTSDQPTLVHVGDAGIVRGLALGTAGITATFGGMTSVAAAVTVLPAVQVEALATGNETVTPGAVAQPVLSLRCINRYLDTRRITALRVAITGPAASLALYSDDGDGIFEAASDTRLASGAPSGGFWSASGLAIDLAVGTPKTVFVAADVSALIARHGDVVDAQLADVGDLFWQNPTAVVGAFPLQSFGELRVRDAALAQFTFDATSDSIWTAGAIAVPAFAVHLPGDGSRADVLDHLELVQQGTARAGIDLGAVRLQAETAGWHDVATCVATGAERWIATGIGLAVPPGGVRVRIVADIALGAASNRSVQFGLPQQACRFTSGRIGAVDGSWNEPAAHRIDAPPLLIVAGRDVADPGPIARTAARVHLLGLDLTPRGIASDSLLALHLNNVSVGAGDSAAADPNAQWAAVELWHDANADGAVGAGDALLESVVLPAGATIEFGAGNALDVALTANVATHLLVTMQPDSSRVRDGERLGVRFVTATTRAGLTLSAQLPLETTLPPVVDGQAASGYAVRATGNTLVTAGSTAVVVFDLTLPANGFEADELQRLRVANIGTATTSDLSAMRLHRDDGDGRYDDGDIAVANFAAIAPRAWEASGLALPLPGGGERWFVVADIAADAVAGRTIEAEIGIHDVEVASGNDGPIDFTLRSGGNVVITASDQVLWVAGVVGTHAVPPAVQRHSVLVLETLNTYATPRTLRALTVAVRGTAAAFEFDRWELVADTNQNGAIDDAETPLALANVSADAVRFEGFRYALDPLQQQRLLVAYSLAPGLARDGAVIDAAIERAADFDYAVEDGAVTTAAQFEMNSPGQDEVDGHVAAQITNAVVGSQTLGGGESNVLALDVVLPSNGWESDVLNAFALSLGGDSDAAQFGADVAALRLWRESDADFAGGRFDPNQDVLLQTLLPGAPLRFDALSVPIPVGGRRFYVSADIATTPADGRTLQIRIPINGVAMASGNDGPIDSEVIGTATHRTSNSTLLAAVTSTPLDPAVASVLDVAVVVRNRSTTQAATVTPYSIALVPGLAATWLSGPEPAQLDLAPGAADTLRYRCKVDTTGTTQFVARVGTPDSSIVAPPAAGPIFDVHHVASSLVLEPRTNLPAVVSRGQAGTTPIIWNVRHGDSDALAGSIHIRSLEIQVETATGAPQSAAAVFERLEIRSGGSVRALIDDVPDNDRLQLTLDPVVEIDVGQVLDLPLLATIAGDAQASAFQLRLAGATCVLATDAGSGTPVPLAGPLPWATPVTAIRSVASQVDVVVTPQLPPEVDRGQRGVAIGTVRFSLPGNPGESEARVMRLGLAFQDSAGAPLDPQSIFDRFEVWSGTSLLLGLESPSGAAGALALPLTIPRPFTSGAPEDIRLLADIRATTPAVAFTASIPVASDLIVQDATSGTTVPCVPVPPGAFPAALGTVGIVDAAQTIDVAVASLLPATTAAGATLRVASMTLTHGATAGTAGVLVRGIQVRVTDAQGTMLAPRDVLAGAELRQADMVIATAATLPAVPAPVALTFTNPVRIDAGAAVEFELRAQLAAAPSLPSFRFALEGAPFDLVDANDPTRLVLPTGTLPFATGTLQVVAPPVAVQLGVPMQPPANLVRGQNAAPVLGVRVHHPGLAHESALRAQTFVVHLRHADATPLDAARIVVASRLRAQALGDVAAIVAGDSLFFDLAAWPALDAGAGIDATLELDLGAESDVSDFRLAIGARGLRAFAGAAALPVLAESPVELPYLSPSVHVAAPDLASSFSNYPNPFAAGRESTRIPFYLAAASRVTVEVRTLSGERVVRLLERAERSAGLHDDLSWNGRNGRGEIVRNGTYLLLIEVEGGAGGTLRRKLAVVR